VITTTDMDLLGYTVIEMFKESLGASFGILFREQEGRGTGFSVIATVGFPDDSTAGVFLLRFGGGIAKLASPVPAVFSADSVVSLTPDDASMLGENRTLFAIRFDLSSGSSMYVVLALRGVPGADVLSSTILNFFYRQVRFALLNAERGTKTQNLIYIDDLTKLYNSRYLNVVLDRELKRSERYRNFFSVLFMDLDFFKRVNDTHGHLVGTRALVEAGSVLRSCVRETDTVVRYGGDEFVVLLVETRAEEAILVAERMRKMIEEKSFGQEMALDIRLTISIGIAAFPEHATTKQHLLNLADQAMYRGKDSTRNVVYLANAQNVL
jgi:diguanylate cyclase (GGDEF)-like protein